MGSSQPGGTGYVIPRYRVRDDTSWYHVLHGNVPGHQIDFMYCPEVPQGRLTATHFSHLARLMKYIEPQTNATHAFAIGNLSRDDTQYEAGHGAVGLIFGFRIGGTTDHAGRGNPPFAHGLIAVDRDLTYPTLMDTAAAFSRHVMNASEANSSAAVFYREYIGAVHESSERVVRVLERYVDEFGDLPLVGRSALPWSWVADESAQPKRVVIVHGNDESFGAIARAAAKIAATLCRTNIKWTSITTGREADIPGGVSVRFIREDDVTLEDRHATVVRLEDIGLDEAEVARGIFRATPYVAEAEKPKYAGWRERYAGQHASGGEPNPGAGAAPPGLNGSAAPHVEVHDRRAAPWAGRGHATGNHAIDRGKGSHASGNHATERPTVVPAPMTPFESGANGTEVLDRDRVFGGAAGAEAAPSERHGGGAARPQSPSQLGLRNGRAEMASGTFGGVTAGATGALGREVVVVAKPLTVHPPALTGEYETRVLVKASEPKPKWVVWALVGLGCAVAAAGVAVALSSMSPAEQHPEARGAEGVALGKSAAPSVAEAKPAQPQAGALSTIAAPQPEAAPPPKAAPPPQEAPPPAATPQPQAPPPPAAAPQPEQAAAAVDTPKPERTKPAKASGAATRKFPPKSEPGKVPHSSSLPEGKPDF